MHAKLAMAERLILMNAAVHVCRPFRAPLHHEPMPQSGSVPAICILRGKATTYIGQIADAWFPLVTNDSFNRQRI